MNQLALNEKEVNDKVMKMITKAGMQVGTDLTPMAIELMAEDLIDAYKYDSMEDIAEALKKGRQGRYGKIYGKLNGLVMAEWMNKHLEEKAIARENLLSQQKANSPSIEDIREVYIKKIEEAEDPDPLTQKKLVNKLEQADRLIKKMLKK